MKSQDISSDPETIKEWIATTQSKGFLGREFLLWLWCFIETKDGEFNVPSSSDDAAAMKGKVWMEDRLVLSSPAGYSREHIIKGTHPSVSDEATVALLEGKFVREMRLGLSLEGMGDFSATVRGEDLCPRGLMLPELGENGEKNAHIGMRVHLTGLFLRALTALYQDFLSARTSPDWQSQGFMELKKWMSARGEKTKNQRATVH